MLPLLDHLDELTRRLAEWGQPDFRRRQILSWLLQRRAEDFQRMTDLPAALRERLAEHFALFGSRVVAHQGDPGGHDRTEKLLLRLEDDERIECVLLRDEQGHRTACISTQVGCPVGCAFCATGLDGLRRNLTRGEIVEQLLHLARLLPEDERLTHVVVMGMGEPLANLDALLPALGIASDTEGLGIGVRRITISTVGLPEGIRRLGELASPYHLAVSLHAADDRTRDRLVPINRHHNIAAVLAAADDYFQRTGRRVTFEYVLLAGVNDRAEDARRLAALLAGRPALVNLIPLNPVEGLPFRAPSAEEVRRFAAQLERGGLNAQVRHRRGTKIDAACGQLRRREPPSDADDDAQRHP